MSCYRRPHLPAPVVQLTALKNTYPDFAFSTVIDESGCYVHADRTTGEGSLRSVTTKDAVQMWRILKDHHDPSARRERS